jgi:hypothetical protein
MKQKKTLLALGLFGLIVSTGPTWAADISDTNLAAAEGLNQSGPQPARVLAPAAGSTILWDNGDTDGSNGYSNATVDAFGSRRTLLDDFVVPAGDTWRVTDIHWLHLWNSLPPGSGTGVELNFWSDAGNTPGAPFATANVTSYSEEATGRVWFDRPEAESWADFDAITLGPGRYWIEATIVGPENNFWLIKEAVREEECWTNYDDFPPLGPCSDQFGVRTDMSWYLTSSGIPFSWDMKLCSNPNAFNCGRTKGKVPLTIFGSAALDVTQIDLNSLQICLADLSACTGAPLSWSIADRGMPSDVDTSDCEEDVANPDGWDDLDVAFSTAECGGVIGCPLGKGVDSADLVVIGTLLDGTELVADNTQVLTDQAK